MSSVPPLFKHGCGANSMTWDCSSGIARHVTAVTDAIALPSADRQRLVVLAQSRQSSDDDNS